MWARLLLICVVLYGGIVGVVNASDDVVVGGLVPDDKTQLIKPGADGSYSKVLMNGLRIIVIPDQSSSVVAHGVFYDVGSFDDPIDLTGMAHILEHLMFGMTVNHSKGEYVKYISKLGGRMNAFTSFDRTFYYSILPSLNGLDNVMSFEADRMRGVVYSDEKALAAEKGVVLGEVSMRDEIMTRVFNSMMQELNYEYRYKRPVIGYVGEISKVSPPDLMSFYDKYYAPDNAVVIVIGNVEPAEIFKKAEANYGHIISSGKEDVSTFGAVRKVLRTSKCNCVKTLEIDAPEEKQGSVSFIASLIGSSGDEYKGDPVMSATMRMIGYALGSHGGGRLNKVLVEQKKLASTVIVDVGGPYLFINVVPVDGVSLDRLTSEIREILKRVYTDGLTEGEIRDISSLAKASAAASEDGVINKLMTMAESMNGWASWKVVHTMIGNNTLNKKSVHDFIRRIMDANDIVCAKINAGGAQ